MSNALTLGIDVGGTNIKAGIVDAAHRVVVRGSIETQAAGGFEHVLARIVAQARQLIADCGQPAQAIAAVGIGVPGPLSHEKGVVFNAPNMPGWTNAPIRDRLAATLRLPVNLENDAKSAAFGEFVAGAGRDAPSMVMLTLGTGIGGGVILDGRLWRGAFENAGEVGHSIVVPGGLPCPCGQRGCLERYASASAIARRAAEAIAAGERSSIKLDAGAAARGEPPTTAEAVQAAAAAGDALAGRIWDEACLRLAQAIVNLQHVLNPQRMVLAGGLINAGAALLDPVRRHVAEQTWRMTQDQPEITLATLGGNAGLIGAAALARPELPSSAP